MDTMDKTLKNMLDIIKTFNICNIYRIGHFNDST